MGAVALLGLGIGVVAQSPAFALVALLGGVYAAYARSVQPGRVLDSETGEPTIEIERRFDDACPEPGDEVTVVVEVQNRGPDLLSDVRIVDGAPPTLEVIEDSPRHGAVLRPGGRATFSYTVEARRGAHRWGPARVVAAAPSGTVEREVRVEEPTTLQCRLPPLERYEGRLPLRGLTTEFPGRIDTDSGGAGLEFYAVREYRRSDPLSRIDWYRRAKTGEFATLQFREERLANVMLVIDARQAAYLAPEPGAANAVERSVDAAHRLFVALEESGALVGVTALGPDEESCWLSVGRGSDHRARARELLTGHPTLSPHPPARERYEQLLPERRETLKRQHIQRLHERLAPDTQVVLLSPCCDDYVPSIARQLESTGHPVTMLSPDPTTDDTPARELAAIERADRLKSLLGHGVRVLDWAADEPVEKPLVRADRRWGT